MIKRLKPLQGKLLNRPVIEWERQAKAKIAAAIEAGLKAKEEALVSDCAKRVKANIRQALAKIKISPQQNDNC